MKLWLKALHCMISTFCDPSLTQEDLSKQAGRTYKQFQECKELLCKLSNCKLKEISWELRQFGAGRGCGHYQKLTFSNDRLVCLISAKQYPSHRPQFFRSVPSIWTYLAPLKFRVICYRTFMGYQIHWSYLEGRDYKGKYRARF